MATCKNNIREGGVNLNMIVLLMKIKNCKIRANWNRTEKTKLPMQAFEMEKEKERRLVFAKSGES